MIQISEEDRKYLSSLAAQGPIPWIESVLVDPTTKAPLKLNYLQKQLLAGINKYNYVCVDETTRVIDPETLRPVRIDSLDWIKETVLYDLTLNKVVWSDAKWIKNPQKKECYKLVFESGKVLRLTPDHEIYTKSLGWIKVKDFKIGDCILTPDKTDIFGTSEETKDGIEFLSDLSQLHASVNTKIFSLTKECLRYYFTYYFANQGRILEKDQELVALFNRTREMAEDHQHLLQRFGIHSRINDDNIIFLCEKHDINEFLNLIGLEVNQTETKPSRCWDKLINVRSIGLRNVYDISVDHEDHNFMASDLVVHNCAHRRGGKTYGIAANILYFLCTMKDLRIIYFAASVQQVKEVFDYIDMMTEASPLIQLMKHKVGNTNTGQPSRKFITGSTITGMALVRPDKVRGKSPDMTIVDEAQDISDAAWQAIWPFMIGDMQGEHRRFDTNINYIIGTIKNPSGRFYNDIFINPPDKSTITKIPVTDRLGIDLTEDDLKALRAECKNDIEWETEFLLKPMGGENTVFPQTIVDKIFKEEYTYGNHLVDRAHVRIMGCDWDRVQSGPSVIIGQYEPLTDKLTVVHQETLAVTDRLLHDTVNRLLELHWEYSVDYVCMDHGGGGFDRYDELKYELERRGFDVDGMLYLLALQSVLWVDSNEPSQSRIARNVNSDTMSEKRHAKEYLVKRLRKRVEEDKLIASGADDSDDFKYLDLKRQLIKYQSKTNPSGRQVFTDKDEHYIDCLMFIEYIIFLHGEDIKEKVLVGTNNFLPEPIPLLKKHVPGYNEDFLWLDSELVTYDIIKHTAWRPSEDFGPI